MFTIVVDVRYRKMSVQILFCSELYFVFFFCAGARGESNGGGESDDAPSVHSGCTVYNVHHQIRQPGVVEVD